MVLKARIQNGQLVAAVPPGYSEGEELTIAVVDDVEHGMTPEEIDALNRSIEQGEREIAEGKYYSAEEVLAELRDRR
jgi:hypothetical protein